MSGDNTLSRQQRRGLLVIGVSICLLFGALMFRSMRSPDASVAEKRAVTRPTTPYDTMTPSRVEATPNPPQSHHRHKSSSRAKASKRERTTTTAGTPPRDHLADEIPAQPADRDK